MQCVVRRSAAGSSWATHCADEDEYDAQVAGLEQVGSGAREDGCEQHATALCACKGRAR